MRDVLLQVEVHPVFGHFDRTGVHPAAEEQRAVGIRGADPVHDEEIIVETGLQRLGEAAPYALLILLEGVELAAVDGHGLRLGSGDAELRAQVGINLGEFAPGHVGSGAERFGGNRRGGGTLPGGQGGERREAQDHISFHRIHHLKSLWANSYRQRRQVSHSWAVLGDW